MSCKLRDKVSIIKSIGAGVLLSISAYCYLTVENRYVGAVLFSVGILSICLLNLNLCTGKAGYVRTLKELPGWWLIVLLNIIGTFICLAFKVDSNIMHVKISSNPIEVAVKSIMCGALIYIAVESYKANKLIISVLAISTFILAGLEHCIADMCYIVLTRYFRVEAIPFILNIVVGNFIGANALHRIHNII